MSLFGSLMNDFDEDPLFGAHFRQMRQMNNMMNSLFCNPFDMMGGMGGPLSIMGSHHRNAMMPFMPQMNMNRLLTGGMDDSLINNARCNSYSSSTLVMSNGPDGRPQVYSASSSTQMGPGGVKETRKTIQDSRTGTKKMSIGHHINDRAHLIEREQNYQSGDLEEREEFINIEEDDADDFNREFETRVRSSAPNRGHRQLPALPAPHNSPSHRREIGARRPLRRLSASPLALPAPHGSSSGAGVRHTYSSLHPQRSKPRGSKHHHHSSSDY